MSLWSMTPTGVLRRFASRLNSSSSKMPHARDAWTRLAVSRAHGLGWPSRLPCVRGEVGDPRDFPLMAANHAFATQEPLLVLATTWQFVEERAVVAYDAMVRDGGANALFGGAPEKDARRKWARVICTKASSQRAPQGAECEHASVRNAFNHTRDFVG